MVPLRIACGKAPRAPAHSVSYGNKVFQSGRVGNNVRVPLAFLRAGMKLLGVIPPQVSEKLAEKGIDLAALRDLNVWRYIP
jgi:hypothetical protein